MSEQKSLAQLFQELGNGKIDLDAFSENPLSEIEKLNSEAAEQLKKLARNIQADVLPFRLGADEGSTIYQLYTTEESSNLLEANKKNQVPDLTKDNRILVHPLYEALNYKKVPENEETQESINNVLRLRVEGRGVKLKAKQEYGDTLKIHDAILLGLELLIYENNAKEHGECLILDEASFKMHSESFHIKVKTDRAPTKKPNIIALGIGIEADQTFYVGEEDTIIKIKRAKFQRRHHDSHFANSGYVILQAPGSLHRLVWGDKQAKLF